MGIRASGQFITIICFKFLLLPFVTRDFEKREMANQHRHSMRNEEWRELCEEFLIQNMMLMNWYLYFISINGECYLII